MNLAISIVNSLLRLSNEREVTQGLKIYVHLTYSYHSYVAMASIIILFMALIHNVKLDIRKVQYKEYVH